MLCERSGGVVEVCGVSVEMCVGKDASWRCVCGRGCRLDMHDFVAGRTVGEPGKAGVIKGVPCAVAI